MDKGNFPKRKEQELVVSNAGMMASKPLTFIDRCSFRNDAKSGLRGIAFRRALPIIPPTYQSSC